MLDNDGIVRQTLIYRIRDSRAKLLALASIPTEAAYLAAEQVQNTRIRVLETPKDVGWGEIALEFVLAFVINSSFVEKLAAKLFSRVFARLLAQQQCLSKIEEAFGDKLLDDFIAAENQLARASPMLLRQFRSSSIVVPSGELGRTLAHWPEIQRAAANLASTEARLSAELARVAKLQEIDGKQLPLYAMGVADVLSKLDKKDAAAFVKATKEAIKKGPPKSTTVSAADSASVGVAEHFLSAAAAQRLHTEAQHNHFEWLVSVLPLQSETIKNLSVMFDRTSLLDGLSKEKIALDSMRSDLKLRLEALIWAIHLGFSKSRNKPDIIQGSTAKMDTCIKGVSEGVTKYLFERFGGLIERLFNLKSWESLEIGPKARYLRDYFWKLTESLDK